MKKIISLLSALAMIATMAVSVSAATEPTLSLEVSSTGLKAGDVVTVVCKYDGYNVTPYNDDEGAGQIVTGAQVRIDIPGGIGTAAEGEQFLRPGVTNISGFSTGSPQWNWDKTNNQFSAVIASIDDAMSSNGTVFTMTMKLNKDVTEDLVFNFNANFDQKIVYDNYVDWDISDTVNNKVTNLVPATLAAPEPEKPSVTYGATAGEEYYLSNDGTTKDVVVKSWNVVAANDGDGSIDLTFTSGDDEKVFALTHDVKGEAAIEFVALLLNAPADVTLTVPVE